MNTALLALNLAPEILLTALALALLIIDVSFLRRRDVKTRSRILGALATVGLVVVLAVLAQHLWQAPAWPIFADAQRVIVIDRLSITLRIIVVLLTLGTLLVSIDFDFTKHVGEHYGLALLATVGLNLLVTTENLLMFFVAVELLSVSLYALTALNKGVLRSAEGALKYFMVGAVSSAFLLFGLSYVVGTTGATNLRDLAAHLATHATAGTSPSLTFIGLVFVLVGLGFKIAVVPFHAWAPDAYEGAPTPVTAFIATGSKVAAFVVAAKILVVGFPAMAGAASFTWAQLLRLDLDGMHFSAGWVSLLALVATASMVWGNVAAIAQKNVKRMLAYSSIAHGGYILVGVVAADRMGMSSVLYYVVAYAIANLGAFGVVAALTRAAGGDDLDDMDGMVQRAPGLSAMLLIFILSLAGVPPLTGFFGKFYVFIAAVNADPQGLGLTWLVVVALATSAVSLYYYLMLLKHVFVAVPKQTARIATPPVQMATLIVLAVLVVVLGAYPQPLVEMFTDQVMMSRLVP